MFKNPMLQAHRGVSTEYPENTMAAFQAAIRQRYDVIELDPNYTADNEIVILHDSTLNRTARYPDGTALQDPINITDLTYSKALEFDYGIGFSEQFKGEQIPLLEHALMLAKENNIIVKIDNKIELFSREASEKLYTLFQKFEPWLALTTGKTKMIRFYAEKFPKAQLHYDGTVNENILKELDAFGDRLTVWLPYRSQLTSWVKVPFADERLCSEVRKYARLGIWIINDYESYEEVCRRYTPDIVETTGAVKPVKE